MKKEKLNKETLIEIARDMFNKALEDFFYPPISEPRIIYNPRGRDGFYIDPENDWKTTLNVNLVPKNLTLDEVKMFLRFVSRHEIGHYIICPYDLVTSILIISAAKKVVKSYEIAMFIANFFADVIDDVERNDIFPGDPIILDAFTIKDIVNDYGNKISPLIKVLIRVKEILWTEINSSKIDRNKKKKINEMFNRKIIRGSEISLTKAFGIRLNNEEEEVARKVASIIKKNFRNKEKWPKATREVARILKNMFKDHLNALKNSCSAEKQQADKALKGDSTSIRISPKDLEDPKKREEIISSIAENVENPEDLKDSLDIIDRLSKKMREKQSGRGGLGSEERLRLGPMDYALIKWYESISRNLIKFKITEKKYVGSIMAYPVKWRISDPIEELDLLSSLSIFPKLIPGITTIKWEKEEQYGEEESKIFPDLLIVIDSSGSMDWSYNKRDNNSRYHLALIGAFSALSYAIMRDVYVAAINFSSGTHIAEWTKDYMRVKHVLISYMGAGTHFPIRTIKKFVIEHAKKFPNNPIYLLIITDAGLSNLEPAAYLLESLLKAKNKVTLFLIGGGRNPFVRAIEDNGGKVYLIRRVKDLVGLIIKDASETYS